MRIGMAPLLSARMRNSADFKYKPNPRPDRVFDKSAVDKSFEALKTFDWGTNYDEILAIDDAVVATHGNAAARKDLETRLAAVLSTDASRPAKDFTCRMLSEIGSADCVPALAGLLADQGPFAHGPLCLGAHRRPRIARGDAGRLAQSQRRIEGRNDRVAGARRDGASVDVLTAWPAGRSDAGLRGDQRPGKDRHSGSGQVIGRHRQKDAGRA